MIDLRSDTVTQPTARMRRAMAEAEVGDDVYREDPTVARLEELAADLVGHEAALFVPSGTMGNQIALHLLGRPGDLVLCESDSHVVQYELGGMAALSGLTPSALPSTHGQLETEDIVAAYRSVGDHASATTVLSLENSHNLAGGTVYRPDRLAAVVATARDLGLRCHLDGARVFNAAAASGTKVSELTAPFDTVNFCLSKGLGAPVGSMLCGSRALMEEARRVRKRLGGGMRQAGVLAAAALVALEEGPKRLPEDHRLARRLADAMQDLPGLEIAPERVETNIVMTRVRGPRGAEALCKGLRRRGVLASALVGGRVRFVTHRDIDASQIGQAIHALREVVLEEIATR